MKTLQDLIDDGMTQRAAANRSARDWQAGQPQREAQAATGFRDYMAWRYSVAIGDDAHVEAHEDPCEPGRQCRHYTVYLTFPALEAFIATRLDRDSHGCYTLASKNWEARAWGNQAKFNSLTEALMWLTDGGQTALCGAIPVALPAYQEA